MNNSVQYDIATGAPRVLAFLRAAQELEAWLDEELAAVGLSTARYGVLAQLADAGEPLSLGALAERLSCVRSNVTQLVDRLETDGLVRRIPDPTDRRSVLAELTEEGWARVKAGAARLEAVQAEFDTLLGRSDLPVLERILASLSQRR